MRRQRVSDAVDVPLCRGRRRQRSVLPRDCPSQRRAVSTGTPTRHERSGEDGVTRGKSDGTLVVDRVWRHRRRIDDGHVDRALSRPKQAHPEMPRLPVSGSCPLHHPRLPRVRHSFATPWRSLLRPPPMGRGDTRMHRTRQRRRVLRRPEWLCAVVDPASKRSASSDSAPSRRHHRQPDGRRDRAASLTTATRQPLSHDRRSPQRPRLRRQRTRRLPSRRVDDQSHEGRRPISSHALARPGVPSDRPSVSLRLAPVKPSIPSRLPVDVGPVMLRRGRDLSQYERCVVE